MSEEKEKKKGGGALKAILILFIIIIVIPIGILVGFYFMNENFNYGVNRVMSDAPIVGSYFEKIPTREEKEDQIKVIAEHYLSVDRARAVDKLILFMNDNREFYDEIIKNMLRINPNATKYILEDIRKATINKDIISATLEQIDEEKSTDYTDVGTYIDKLNNVSALEEMNKIINSSINGYKLLANVIEKMADDRAAELIDLLEYPELLMDNLTESKRNSVLTARAERKNRKKELINISEIYATEGPDKLYEIIGDTDNYTIDELAVIYKQLGVVKSGKVLAKVENDEFVYQLINKIQENETLAVGEDFISKDILKTIKVYSQFDDNINELSNVYQNMSTEKVTEVVSQMLRNGAESEIYVLDNGEVIAINDEYLALKVLQTFEDKKIAEILSIMDSNLSADVAKKMTLPQFE